MRDLYALAPRIEDGDFEDEKVVTISAEVPAGPLDNPEEYGNPSPEDIGHAIQTMFGIQARLVLFAQSRDWKVRHNLNCAVEDYEDRFTVSVTCRSAELDEDDPGPPSEWLKCLAEEDKYAMRAGQVREENRARERRMWQGIAATVRAWMAEHPDADDDVPSPWRDYPATLPQHGQVDTADMLRDYQERRREVRRIEQEQAAAQLREVRERAEHERAERHRQAEEEAEAVRKRWESEGWHTFEADGPAVVEPRREQAAGIVGQLARVVADQPGVKWYPACSAIGELEAPTFRQAVIRLAVLGHLDLADRLRELFPDEEAA